MIYPLSMPLSCPPPGAQTKVDHGSILMRFSSDPEASLNPFQIRQAADGIKGRLCYGTLPLITSGTWRLGWR